ncbi:SSU ribosomal protein S18P [Mariprofundus aestuarium]|uniref:Small ribosomal subunit protein bS18 n=1 Tax=Mariprofundus aestuarium TaxID=1921086 RepID=A0A2K8KWT7_MARES|nr:SSU ribosomal protein S18P [Mariprofundus aestuarium]
MSEEVKTTAAPAQGDRPQRTERPQGDRPARPQGDRPRRPQGARPQGRFQSRRKFCKFCADTSLNIDHKDPDMLRGFITERCKILPSRVTGTCAKHQRSLTTAIKRARILALVAFTPLHHD